MKAKATKDQKSDAPFSYGAFFPGADGFGCLKPSCGRKGNAVKADEGCFMAWVTQTPIGVCAPKAQEGATQCVFQPSDKRRNQNVANHKSGVVPSHSKVAVI